MALSATEIDVVVREIAPHVTGGWVQKVLQPSPAAITLEIRARGQTLSLFLSAEPGTARLHLLSQHLANPPFPPPFCQYLRAHIQGSRIERLEQIGGDRLVRITLTTKEGPYSLIAALTGRSADLLLLDAQDRILHSLHYGREKAGQVFTPTTARPPARAEVGRAEPLERDEEAPFPISRAIERRYQQRDQESALRRHRQARLAHIRRSTKKAGRRVEALRADIDKAERYRDYARYGELLKANLGGIARGQDQVTVVDYFDPVLPELVIPLDPAKSAQGNMDDYFKKHRKHLTAEREVRPRLQQAEQELRALRAERRAIELGTWEPPAGPAPSPAGGRKAEPPPRKARPARSGPFRRFTSTDGLPIYVGRNSRENEELTLKFAHSDDLWLHARGTPGSHVVVRLEKGAEPPHETLRDAATLALLYSDLKKSGKGEVIYTRNKWVKKAKGKPPGTVTVTREKALWISLDKTRLQALKDRSRP